jgi:hypothetical protein
MTDEELQTQYGGYSDDQLVEYIAQGIPDSQAAEFQRLLRLRRQAHYKDIVGISSQPPQLSSGGRKPATKTQRLTPDPEPTRETKTTFTEAKSEKPKKKGCVAQAFKIILIVIAALILLFIIGILTSH